MDVQHLCDGGLTFGMLQARAKATSAGVTSLLWIDGRGSNMAIEPCQALGEQTTVGQGHMGAVRMPVGAWREAAINVRLWRAGEWPVPKIGFSALCDLSALHPTLVGFRAQERQYCSAHLGLPCPSLPCRIPERRLRPSRCWLQNNILILQHPPSFAWRPRCTSPCTSRCCCLSQVTHATFRPDTRLPSAVCRLLEGACSAHRSRHTVCSRFDRVSHLPQSKATEVSHVRDTIAASILCAWSPSTSPPISLPAPDTRARTRRVWGAARASSLPLHA